MFVNKVKSRFLLVLFGISFLLMCVGEAKACWCRTVSTCEAVNSSKAAFVGTVLQILPVGAERNAWPMQNVIFQVDEPFFGVTSKQITINTGSADGNDCSRFPFRVGTSYVVFARGTEGNELYAGRCGGTKNLDDADKSLAYLRSLRAETNNGIIFGDAHGVEHDTLLNIFRGAFLSGVRLRLKGDGIERFVVTDESGGYSFGGLKPGKYSLEAALPSYYGFKYPEDSVNREIELNGRGCSHEDFFADVKNSIEGRVTDTYGKPLKSVEVSLIPATQRNDDVEENSYSAFTDSDGRYVINYIFPRDYFLGINIEMDSDNEPREGRLFYPNAANEAAATRIEFRLGTNLTNFDLVLDK